MRYAHVALNDPSNYEARAELMWASSLSHNGLLSCGNDGGDWASHQLEHELGGMFDVAHGAGLAAVWGSWARYVYKQRPERFARYAKNVFGIDYAPGQEEEASLKGIAATENFFRSINMPTSICELGYELTDAQIDELAHKCVYMGKRKIGKFMTLDEPEIREIYKMAR
jgi:alcohol dehydrogenase YqhD (iron-dependent ADH family)